MPGIPVVLGISATVDRFTKAMEGAQERVLADVCGVVWADDSRGYAKDDVAMSLHEPFERAKIASKRALDERAVCKRCGGK